jgi:hypothetical protein
MELVKRDKKEEGLSKNEILNLLKDGENKYWITEKRGKTDTAKLYRSLRDKTIYDKFMDIGYIEDDDS